MIGKALQMLSRRRIWLERIANWGTAVAVPLVAVIGFKLLTHARDAAQPVASPAGVPAQPAPAAGTGRVLAPPIDASAPPVVNLRPPAAADPRCASLEAAIRKADAEAEHAAGADSSRMRDRGRASRAEARTLGCALR